MWVALGISTAAALVSAGVAWWQTRAVALLRKELDAATGQMHVITNALKTAIAEWAEDRKRMAEANGALMEANKNALAVIRRVVSAPGVPANLAGEWLDELLATGPRAAVSAGDGKAMPPITRSAPRTTPSREKP